MPPEKAKEPSRALAQIELASKSGVAGLALFSYDSIAESGDAEQSPLLGALRSDARAPAAPDRSND